MTDLVTARDVIAAARTRVIRALAYFAPPVMSLRPFPLAGIGTFGVDAESRMAYDPETAIAWGAFYSGTGVFHEALHILLNHHGRRRGREARKWNLSCDCEVNRIVLDAGFEFPRGFHPVIAETFKLKRGMLAEEYYELIPDDAAQAVGESKFPGCGQNDGNGAGAPQGWENDVDKLSGGIEGQGPADQRTMRRETAEKIQAAVHSKGGKGIGTVPAGLQVWSSMELTPPVVPWQNVLASVVRSAVASKSGADDYTRMRISRRSTGLMGLPYGTPILPGLRSPKPEIALVLDFSGSMRGDPVRVACSEAVGVVKALGLPVRAYAVDAEVQAVATLLRPQDIEKLNRGGGGTNMVVGIRAADKAKPDVIVLFTDAQTPWPSPNQMPRAKLVVGVIGDGKVPDYITRVVRIPVRKEDVDELD